MTPWSGAVWACADVMTPGSASAAARSAAAPSRSVAATAASTDAIAAARALLALVDVLRALRCERVGVELHLGLGEIALFPGLRRLDGGARARKQSEREDDAGASVLHRGNPSAPREARGSVARLRAFAHRES